MATTGNESFGEETNRNLTAGDSAVMVMGGGKGIEEQTRKRFEVCRLRDVPIMTFVNKFDRESREPFDLIGEVEQTLALDATPASWPIGMGGEFLGCYALFHDRLVLLSRSNAGMTGDRKSAGRRTSVYVSGRQGGCGDNNKKNTKIS